MPMPIADARRYAPAALRNREPIREVLAAVLPAEGRVLELGAGTGEHAVHFARAFPALIWQPTDADPESLASIAGHAAEAGLPNLLPPMALDVRPRPWPAISKTPFDAVLSINMIHIAPWSACEGIMAGAARVIRDGGLLVLYGPFMIEGRHTAPSNAAFDRSLKQTDPDYGVRDVVHVSREADTNGFTLASQVSMPANNFTLVFAKRSGA